MEYLTMGGWNEYGEISNLLLAVVLLLFWWFSKEDAIDGAVV